MEVYPKVKVRLEEDDDNHAFKPGSLQSLKAFESLSVRDFSSPVKDIEDDSSVVIARIPGSNISNTTVPKIPISKGAVKNNKKIVEETKLDIKTSQVSRPRAVLSSPDNDGVIGSRNRRGVGRSSGLKDHNLCQDRHTRCKANPKPIVFGSPLDTRSPKVASGSGNGPLQKRGVSLS